MAERKVERRLAQRLGPAEKYDVHIRGTRETKLLRGRADRVDIEGRKIRAQGRFLVDSLRITLLDLRYGRGEPVTIGNSELEVEFTDDALNQYLKTYHNRHQPEVNFDPGRVGVRMVYEFLGSPVPVHATGRLVIQEGRQLVFDAESTDFGSCKTPEAGERFVEERVNPLLDLTEIDFEALLESVEVLEGRIRARGKAAVRPRLE
jgi:DUF2993 family protein